MSEDKVPWPVEVARSAGSGVVCLSLGLVLLILGVAEKASVASAEIELAGPFARAAILVVAAVLAVVGSRILLRKGRHPELSSPAPAGTQAAHFFDTLDAAENLTKAFSDCERIDLMLRTGANVLQRYRSPLIKALASGTQIRILVLDPACDAARIVYGPGSDRYLNNARLLPDALGDLEGRAKHGRLSIRKTKYLPPFSMFISHKRVADQSYVRSQINFTHTVVGGDRPTFKIEAGDRWFEVFESEFREAWKAGSRTNSKNLRHIVAVLEKAIDRPSDLRRLFEEQTASHLEGCAFDDDPSDPVWQTSSTRVIANIAPIVENHCLVIPKRHVERLSELTTGELYDLAETCRDVSLRLMISSGATGVNWALQDGRVAGQTVPHLHVHIIPRRAGDLRSPGDWFGELPGGAEVAQAVDDPTRTRKSHEQLNDSAHVLRELLESAEEE